MNFTAGRIDPGLLATFIAVADKKSVSGATDLLHFSQPAVTAQIKRLEDSLGAPLFLRSVQGMRVTAKGLQLYDYAREIARLLAEADRVVGKSEEPEGQLRIAASTTISSYVLPAALAAFCRLNPRIAVDLIVVNTEEVLRRVRDGLCPLGLVEGLPRVPQLRLTPFVDDELVLIRGARASAQELARKTDSVRRARDLRGLPLIWREKGSGTRAMTERALRAAGVNLRHLARQIVIGKQRGLRQPWRQGLASRLYRAGVSETNWLTGNLLLSRWQISLFRTSSTGRFQQAHYGCRGCLHALSGIVPARSRITTLNRRNAIARTTVDPESTKPRPP